MKAVPVDDIEKLIKKFMIFHCSKLFTRDQVVYILKHIIEKNSTELNPLYHCLDIEEII